MPEDQWPSARANSAIAVDCMSCGAGYEIPRNRESYMCTSCGASIFFWSCPSCDRAQQVQNRWGMEGVNCWHCGKTSPLRKWVDRPAEAAKLLPESVRFRPGSPVDPAQRVVAGVVAAASVPGLWPGLRCVLLFSADCIGVQSGSGEVARFDYRDVNSLEIGGSGTRRYTTSAGIIGGGFGVQGALEGMAVASLINSVTAHTTVTRDTTLNLRAGARALLMNADMLEPATLRVILAPVYDRIERASASGRSSGPAGWYPDPGGSGSQRYWDVSN
jgi:hypothetical protein